MCLLKIVLGIFLGILLNKLKIIQNSLTTYAIFYRFLILILVVISFKILIILKILIKFVKIGLLIHQMLFKIREI